MGKCGIKEILSFEFQGFIDFEVMLTSRTSIWGQLLELKLSLNPKESFMLKKLLFVSNPRFFDRMRNHKLSDQRSAFGGVLCVWGDWSVGVGRRTPS